MLVSVEMLGNGRGAEPGVVEVEAVAVTENWVKRLSEANGLTLAGLEDFRVLFGAAGLRVAEARMSAAVLGLGIIVRVKAKNMCTGPDYLGKDGNRRRGTPMSVVHSFRSSTSAQSFRYQFLVNTNLITVSQSYYSILP